jgi:hypothetical protein
MLVGTLDVPAGPEDAEGMGARRQNHLFRRVGTEITDDGLGTLRPPLPAVGLGIFYYFRKCIGIHHRTSFTVKNFSLIEKLPNSPQRFGNGYFATR